MSLLLSDLLLRNAFLSWTIDTVKSSFRAMDSAAPLYVQALVDSLPLFESFVHPHIQPSTARQVYAVATIWAVALIAYITTLFVTMRRLLQQKEMFWLYRVMQRPEGRYLQFNSILVWRERQHLEI